MEILLSESFSFPPPNSNIVIGGLQSGLIDSFILDLIVLSQIWGQKRLLKPVAELQNKKYDTSPLENKNVTLVH